MKHYYTKKLSLSQASNYQFFLYLFKIHLLKA